MDPVELRLKNTVCPGDDWGNPYPCQTTGLNECIRLGARRIGWGELPRILKSNEGRRYRRGLGVCCGNHVSSGFPFQIDHSHVFMALLPDGSVQIATGMMEMGPGIKTALCQIAAESVGVALPYVSCTINDSETGCYDTGAQASRSVYTTGHAVMNAGQALRADILKFASGKLGVDAKELDLRDAVLRAADARELATLAQLAKELDDLSRQLTRTGDYTSYNACSWHAHFADVTVDTWTGEVRVNKIVAAHDVGRAINPTLVEGQIEGGVSMGIGYALSEEIRYDGNGRQIQDSYHKYMVPMSMDMGEIEAHIVETNEPSGPYGAKGVAENPVGAVPPAVAHAIRNATGVWMTEAPMTPERVLQALDETGVSPYPLRGPAESGR
jgi:xanthine dehydrogenase molybdenum-binding subunit